MHAYRKLIEDQMSAANMTQAELSRASGVTRQRINQILKSDKSRLVHVPDTTTIEGFAKAFHLPVEAVWTSVAEAMGLPRFVVPSITHQVKDVENAQLLTEVARRLGLEVSVRPARTAPAEDQKTDGAGLSLVPNLEEVSEPGETVIPAADDVNTDVDESPGGSDERA